MRSPKTSLPPPPPQAVIVFFSFFVAAWPTSAPKRRGLARVARGGEEEITRYSRPHHRRGCGGGGGGSGGAHRLPLSRSLPRTHLAPRCRRRRAVSAVSAPSAGLGSYLPLSEFISKVGFNQLIFRGRSHALLLLLLLFPHAAPRGRHLDRRTTGDGRDDRASRLRQKNPWPGDLLFNRAGPCSETSVYCDPTKIHIRIGKLVRH